MSWLLGKSIPKLIIRTILLTFFLTVAWTAWVIYPPQPELQRVLSVATGIDWYRVSSDGRSLVCATHSQRWSRKYGPQTVSIYELPDFNLRGTFSERIYNRIDFSPNGSRIACIDSAGDWICRALPSGVQLWSLPPGDLEKGRYHNVLWSGDGQFALAFDSGMSVFRADTGKLVNRVPVTLWRSNQRPDGSGFVARSTEGWQLLTGRFDSAEFTKVPLPGEPRAVDDYGALTDVATNNDGSKLFAILGRPEIDGTQKWTRSYLARWDQSTQQWSEADLGPSEVMGRFWPELRIDTTGRFITTEGVSRGQIGDSSRTEERRRRETEAERFRGRQLWEATSSPPRCLNDSGFPSGVVYFDPHGKRIVQSIARPQRKYVIYDLSTLKPLASHNTMACENDPLFSRDGRWAVLHESDQGHRVNRLPAWVPTWIRPHFDEPAYFVRVIRLSDGKTSRVLPLRYYPSLANNDKLWTATPIDSSTVNVERWSAEAPTPWTMVLLSTLVVGVVGWDVRRHFCNR